MYENEFSYPCIFNAAFFWSTATILDPVFLLTLPCLWLILIVYSVNKWRAWITSLIGMIAPYFLLFIFCFITNAPYFSEIFTYSTSLQFGFHWPVFNYSFLILCLVFMICIFSIFHTKQGFYDLEIPKRKKTTVIMVFFFYFLVFSLTFGLNQFNYFPLFIPMAFFASNFFTHQKETLLRESLFYLLLILILIRIYVL
ncbi:MAG: hypothetical protein RRX93_00130 [Bacteroidales bacterium]